MIVSEIIKESSKSIIKDRQDTHTEEEKLEDSILPGKVQQIISSVSLSHHNRLVGEYSTRPVT